MKTILLGNNSTICFFVENPNVVHCQNELESLVKLSVRVHLFCTSLPRFDFGEAVIVHQILMDSNGLPSSKLLHSAVMLLQDQFLAPFNLAYWKAIRTRRARLKNAFKRASAIENIVQDLKLGELPMLSYWFDDWSLSLALLRKWKSIHSFSTQAHGRDLYEDREPSGKKLAFRRATFKELEKVYCVSQNGLEYLKHKYPGFQPKLALAYLGSERLYEAQAANKAKRKFTISSCSKIRNIKRIHLIAEALLNFEHEVHWIHFGDLSLDERHHDYSVGRMIRAVQNVKRQNKKVTIELRGDCTNQEIQKAYASGEVDLHINTSETEGLPVSMMEAISYGIPLLGTDVGGVKEIIQRGFGILLEKDFTPEALEEGIRSFEQRKDRKEISEEAKSFWETHFDLHRNVKNLIEKLTKSSV